MSEHERIETLLSALLDGELELQSERIEAVDHLARCTACRAFWNRTRALGGLLELAELASTQTPSPAATRRRLAAAPPPSSEGRWRQPDRFLRLAAMVALLFGMAFVWWPRSPGADGAVAVEESRSVEVELGSDGGAMTEGRFVALTAELLRGDQRYREAMLKIMEEVRQADPSREFADGEITEGEARADAAREAGRV